jgi:uncharacterized phage protein (TIGR02218 family)
MLRLDLRDGTVLGFTDHDQVLNFDLGDAAGAIDYRPDFGMAISNVQTAIGLDAGNYEATFPVALAPKATTREAFVGGRFNRCEARLFEVVWSNLAAGARKVMFGNAGEWRVEGDKAICEVRDQRDRLNQTTGTQIQNQCDADYADQVECFATATEITGTVTVATSALALTVSYAGGPYAERLLQPRDTDRPHGRQRWPQGSDLELDRSRRRHGRRRAFHAAGRTPSVSDTFTVRDGCERTRAACMAHGQILNARAFFDVPGQKALKPAVPAARSLAEWQEVTIDDEIADEAVTWIDTPFIWDQSEGLGC